MCDLHNFGRQHFPRSRWQSVHAKDSVKGRCAQADDVRATAAIRPNVLHLRARQFADMAVEIDASHCYDPSSSVPVTFGSMSRKSLLVKGPWIKRKLRTVTAYEAMRCRHRRFT